MTRARAVRLCVALLVLAALVLGALLAGRAAADRVPPELQTQAEEVRHLLWSAEQELYTLPSPARWDQGCNITGPKEDLTAAVLALSTAPQPLLGREDDLTEEEYRQVCSYLAAAQDYLAALPDDLAKVPPEDREAVDAALPRIAAAIQPDRTGASSPTLTEILPQLQAQGLSLLIQSLEP